MDKVIVIAEAGVNHNGELENALKLIQIAAEAGADYVKFQTFKADKIVSRNAKKAQYQIDNINDGDNSQYEMLKKLEMPLDWYPVLLAKSDELGVKFLSTGFDEESIDFLDEFGVDFYKIPSGEITNRDYLVHISRKGKPIVLSTGMANLEDICAALDIFLKEGISISNITVLHCNTEYPTPFEDVNLYAMHSIRDAFNVKIGYSDHTKGIEVSIAAVALGASVIEKHFTISREMVGPDHAASLEPDELKEMVKSIRNIEKAISGTGIKKPSGSELKNMPVVRKSLHYSRDLEKGELISKADLIALRPGSGLSPMKIEEITGKPLRVAVKAFQMVDLNDL
jgi:N-acetylneuraminate synthase/N,N'-diacetyllegionaminate synthase